MREGGSVGMLECRFRQEFTIISKITGGFLLTSSESLKIGAAHPPNKSRHVNPVIIFFSIQTNSLSILNKSQLISK